MDPLFWILAVVVSICVIGIVVLWLMERRATNQLATQQAEDSARLKAADPRDVLEEIDTRPIPAAEQPPTRRSARGESAAPLSSAYGYTTDSGQSSNPGERADFNQPAAPRPPMQIVQPPKAPQGWARGRQEADNSRAERAQPPPMPQPPADFSPAPPPALAADTPLEPPAAEQQEQLQTTPERAMLRAAELARERHSLEQLLEDNRARLETLLLGSAPPDDEEAAAISLLQSEMAGQRERLQEITFLEQNYRQVASSVAEQLAQQKRQAAPNAPGAFGVRRHPLARIQPPEQD